MKMEDTPASRLADQERETAHDRSVTTHTGMSRRTVIGLAAAAATAVTATWSSETLAQSARRWARAKKRVRVRDLSMAYYETGRGDPIVFLHGNPTSSYLWRNVIPHVAHLGRCIAPDMIGMGDSEVLKDSGPGRYTFVTHRDYLFDLLDAIGVRERVTLVVHDWGSGMGFSWAQRYPERIKGLAYMEAILRQPGVPPNPEPTTGPFSIFRSPAGEKAVIEENMFVEQLLIGGLGYYLTAEDQTEYRRPYLVPGESRRPTLDWPRQLPMAGGPADTQAIVSSYTAWLASDTRIPKLFVRAIPGAILANPQLLEYVRTFKNQREITVYGTHYVQETAPNAIGRALNEWLVSLG